MRQANDNDDNDNGDDADDDDNDDDDDDDACSGEVRCRYKQLPQIFDITE